MRQLSESLIEAVHPTVLQAIQHYRETGVIEWTEPPGVPVTEGPHCVVCLDAGEVAIREPGVAEPKYVPCSACDARETRRRRHLEDLLTRIPVDFAGRTMDDYHASAQTEQARLIGAQLYVWARENAPGSAMLVGAIGALKTTAASAAFALRVEQGHARSAEWVPLPDLLAEIRQCYDRELGVPTESEVIVRYRTCDLLVLDDLGAAAITDRNAPWVQEILYRVINHRANHRLATIFTSNLSTAQLREQLGPAIVSRIEGMCLGRWWAIDQDGTDFRTVG